MNDQINQNPAEVFAFVPSYNHAPFVEKCLRSIINQTHQPKKLLVIDDGSRDGSPAVIERILNDCPFDAELVVRENRGLCATLNEGFGQSSGEYFAYLGSDDFWLEDFLRERVRLLSANSHAVLGYGNALFVDENDEISDCSADWWNFPANAQTMLRQGNAPISSTVCYRRKPLENYRWNENARLEDYEFYVQICGEGEFAFDSQVLSAWRRHGSNVSGDLSLMLAEILAAQRRNPEKLDLNEANVQQTERRVKFGYAGRISAKRRQSRSLQTRRRKLARRGFAAADSQIFRPNARADADHRMAAQTAARKIENQIFDNLTNKTVQTFLPSAKTLIKISPARNPPMCAA